MKNPDRIQTRARAEKPRAAFTLIEMLVVIAIIALLAGILVPTVGSALNRGRTVKGLSNLRQIGQGFMLYALQNYDQFPYEQTNSGVTWHIDVAPYLDGFENADFNRNIGKRPLGVYACPNSKSVTRGGNYADYGMNILVNGHKVNDHENKGRPRRGMADVPNPSGVILLGDALNCARGLRVGSTNGLLDPRQGKDRVNVLFVDGHVETRPIRPLWLELKGDRNQQAPWGWSGWPQGS